MGAQPFPAVDRAGFVDRPFGCPPDIEIHLPLPPSVNKIWRHAKAGKTHVSLSDEYIIWKKRADKLAISMAALRGVRKIKGAFEARIVITRGKGDLDNRIKAVLDWAQSRELVADDKHCERLVVEYGNAPHGCILTLIPRTVLA